MAMLEIKERDDRLHRLYRDRNFLEFMYGEQWFQEQVRKVHWDWEQGGTWLEVSDDDVVISQIAFEIDNGY
jgi:hypothetical protein